MNQVPTPGQNEACLSHIAMLQTCAQKFTQLQLTPALHEHGFTVSKGISGSAQEQAVVVRIQGTLPTTLDQFVHDMRDDEFMRRIDSSVKYSKTLVRYSLQHPAAFGDVMLRHIRIEKAIPGMKDMECALFYTTRSQFDASGRVTEIRVRSHSLTPRDIISLYLRPEDTVIQNPEHYDQIQELFSEIVLTRDPLHSQRCQVDHVGVYQMPGVTPMLYEAVMLRTMLSKYCNVCDYYDERPVAASNVAAPLMVPTSVSAAFFAPANKPLATAAMRAQLQSAMHSSIQSTTVPSGDARSLATWFTSASR